MLPFAETILRCSPMADLGNRCPYEVITGIKPRLPTAMLTEHPREHVPVTQYVQDLVRYMQETYRSVQRLQVAAQQKAEGTHSGRASAELEIGDSVLVKREPSAARGGPLRFQPRTYPGVYKVDQKIGHNTFKLVDFANPAQNPSFGKPAHADRLIKLDLPEVSLDPQQPRQVELLQKDGVTWQRKYIACFQQTGGFT